MILLKYYVDYIHKTQECEQIPNYSKINDESSIGEGTKWSGNNGKWWTYWCNMAFKLVWAFAIDFPFFCNEK